ncbi:glutamate 5-kinase [Clostridium lacusfryxellense]|uniref:glutamate 5-kinase n=1 Tax=Clostridium lacusfryxellense TaxID=205328 RepID=UPI001C0DBAC0|nr:glutamate 5-kinase [Clostridium lacusfryxellense]MBU3114173.1 glutamate 5-kinase [Clostridium lacusfryxellense]
MNNRKEYLKNVTRVVVKVGTSTLTHSTGLLNYKHIENLIRQLADIHNKGIEVVLVTSGAIGAGMGKLGLRKRPETIPEKQAAAAVGQGILIHMYEKFFSEYGKTTAQILLTREDIEDSARHLNAHNTFLMLLSQGVIPVVNENDAVIVDEIMVGDNNTFGDNDTLSARVTNLIDADLLIILSDIDGLYDSNPRINPDAKIIYNVQKITDEIRESAEGAGTDLGTGGMATKIKAAEIVASANAAMIIAEGSTPNVITDILEGIEIGTLFERNIDNIDLK